MSRRKENFAELERLIIIDGARALRLIREVVAEHGADTIYQAANTAACRYEHSGACSCLVGHALYRAGVTVEQLAEMDAVDSDTQIDIVPLPDGVEIDEWAREIFRAAQQKQDCGYTWGSSLAFAEDKAAQFGVAR